jgi:plasmid stability protein
MAQLLVRNLAEHVKLALQRRARQHGRSMEEEARRILEAAVETSERGDVGWASSIAAQFSAIGFTDEEAAELGCATRSLDRPKAAR